MKVIAKHWVKYGDRWYKTGEQMDVSEADAADLKGYIIVPEGKPKQTRNEPKPAAKRTRKRKAEN